MKDYIVGIMMGIVFGIFIFIWVDYLTIKGLQKGIVYFKYPNSRIISQTTSINLYGKYKCKFEILDSSFVYKQVYVDNTIVGEK